MQHGPLAGGGASVTNKAGTAGKTTTTTTTTTTSSAVSQTQQTSQASHASHAALVADRSELPARFGRLAWAEGEGAAVESGGASLW